MRARLRVSMSTHAAYRGIYTDEYLEGLSVEDRAQRWAETGKGHLAIDDPRYGVFIAIDKGKHVGFADIGPCDFGTEAQAKLYAMYIDPDCQGSDIGKALFRECVAHAKKHGFKSMTIEVLSRNDQGRHFYERMQGTPVPESEQLVSAGGTMEKVISYCWPTL